MSLPPLPEVFGNYALKDFAEVTAPADISWWPQTAGWWMAGTLLACLAIYRLALRLRHWYRNRYRREAVDRLQALRHTATPETLPSEVNRLLKITAIAAFSREQVARLSGTSWVAFLNQQCSDAVFVHENADLLANGTYRRQPADKDRTEQLLSASLAWVQTHRGRFDA